MRSGVKGNRIKFKISKLGTCALKLSAIYKWNNK